MLPSSRGSVVVFDLITNYLKKRERQREQRILARKQKNEARLRSLTHAVNVGKLRGRYAHTAHNRYVGWALSHGITTVVPFNDCYDPLFARVEQAKATGAERLMFMPHHFAPGDSEQVVYFSHRADAVLFKLTCV
jgi:cytosine/adenosine deaminase-related metal-dependent hydrolase